MHFNGKTWNKISSVNKLQINGKLTFYVLVNLYVTGRRKEVKIGVLWVKIGCGGLASK